MIRRLIYVVLVSLGLSTTAAAGGGPIVVELFTSQGCEDCTGAIEVLNRISREDREVIALIWSVNYWDYLGWEDTMAIDASAERQQAYNARIGEIGVYTPQTIINGVGQVVGNRDQEVRQLLSAHRASDTMLDVRFEGPIADMQVVVGGVIPETAVVSFVWYREQDTVRVNAGENQGSIFYYENVVRSLSADVSWDRAYPIVVDIAGRNIADSDCVAVLITDGINGPVIGAAKIRFADVV